MTLDDLRQQRSMILEVARKFHAYDVRVFGSVARGESTSASDIDLLVSFTPGYRLWDVIGLTQELRELLGCPVDVVNEASLRAEFRPYVMKDALSL